MFDVDDLYKPDFNAQLIHALWRIGLTKTSLSPETLLPGSPFLHSLLQSLTPSNEDHPNSQGQNLTLSNKKLASGPEFEEHRQALEKLLKAHGTQLFKANEGRQEKASQTSPESKVKILGETLGKSSSGFIEDRQEKEPLEAHGTQKSEENEGKSENASQKPPEPKTQILSGTLENSSRGFIAKGLEKFKNILPKQQNKKENDQKHAASTVATLNEEKSTAVLFEALINFQNKKQKLMRMMGTVFSFFYAVLSSVMNVVAFLGAFSLSVTCTWIFGILMFVTGFQVNFLGSYRVVADMFSKAITYISNGCFWKSVFGYLDENGKWAQLSKTGKGLVIGGFFASLAASFGTSFLATQSLATILISLHVLSAAFPPAWAIVCIATFTLFMTPVLTYAFSSLIKSNPLQQVKNFFKKIFSPQDDNERENRGFKIFQGICTLALLGLSIFGLWATMATFNTSMDTMLKGVFKVSKAIANGVSLGIGIVANFVAQIPFVVETVGRSVGWFCKKISAWFCKSNQDKEQASSPQTSEATKNPSSAQASSVYEKVSIFFLSIWSAWTWFTKIGSGVGEASIAIDGKDASSYPAAVGQGISAACSASLDEEVDEEKERIKKSLIKKPSPPSKEEKPVSPKSQSTSNAPRSSTPTEPSTRSVPSPSNSSEPSLNNSQSFFGKEEREPSRSASQSSHSLSNALPPSGPAPASAPL